MQEFANNNNGTFVLMCFMAPFVVLMIAGLLKVFMSDVPTIIKHLKK